MNKEDSHDSGKQITLGEAIERTIPYTHGSKRWKAITELVTHFMAKEMIPISSIEKPGFVSMVKKLDPQYDIPSRKFLANLHCYHYIQKHIKERQRNCRKLSVIH